MTHNHVQYCHPPGPFGGIKAPLKPRSITDKTHLFLKASPNPLV